MGKHDPHPASHAAASADPLAAGAADVGAEAEVEFDDGLVEVTNLGSMPMKFVIDGRTIKLPPKKSVRVPKAYGMLRVGANPNGDKLPSVVAVLTNFMVQPSEPSQRMDKNGRIGQAA